MKTVQQVRNKTCIPDKKQQQPAWVRELQSVFHFDRALTRLEDGMKKGWPKI